MFTTRAQDLTDPQMQSHRGRVDDTPTHASTSHSNRRIERHLNYATKLLAQLQGAGVMAVDQATAAHRLACRKIDGAHSRFLELGGAANPAIERPGKALSGRVARFLRAIESGQDGELELAKRRYRAKVAHALASLVAQCQSARHHERHRRRRHQAKRCRPLHRSAGRENVV